MWTHWTPITRDEESRLPKLVDALKRNPAKRLPLWVNDLATVRTRLIWEPNAPVRWHDHPVAPWDFLPPR